MGHAYSVAAVFVETAIPACRNALCGALGSVEAKSCYREKESAKEVHECKVWGA